MKPGTIAIDGPAASGKSTLAKRLAEKLGYLYFDTGVMYRAITWATLQRNADPGDEEMVTFLAESVRIDVLPPSVEDGRDSDIQIDGQDITWDIRKPEVDANVSIVSAYPGVRTALTDQQRRIGHCGCVVMVGRDIGTVVLPDADLKIFLDASVEERARRRYREKSARKGHETYENVLETLRRRDKIDSTRDIAPLRVAEDAIIIDSDQLTIDQVLKKVLVIVNEWRNTN